MCPAFSGLKATADYQRVAKQGTRRHAPAFIMQILKKEPEAPFRLGLTASRKVGGAVVRNRAKRRLREMARACPFPFPPGYDVVLIAKTAAATHDFKLLCADFAATLRGAGLVP